MRLPFLMCSLLLFSVGMAFAQDTNFVSGPQYLINGPAQYARSISTPSMSLPGPALAVGASNATGDLVAGSQDRIVPTSQPDAAPRVDLFPIYYGKLSGTAPETLSGTSDAMEMGAAEIRIGVPSAESARLPASIVDTGGLLFTTVQALRERGYGVGIVELAAFEKTHSRHAGRVYTNADIERLHDGG